MNTFSTTGRVLGVIGGLVLVAAIRPMVGKDYGALGLWAFICVLAGLMVAYGIETVIRRIRK